MRPATPASSTATAPVLRELDRLTGVDPSVRFRQPRRSVFSTSTPLSDLVVPVRHSWRAGVRRLGDGLLRLQPSAHEELDRAALARVQRPLESARTVVVVNPRGGSHRTTAALMLSATLGRCRDGSVLAWDADDARGTLGRRTGYVGGGPDAGDLQRALLGPGAARPRRLGDLDAYVRHQRWGGFDVLAAGGGGGGPELHSLLTTFYRLVVVDTGDDASASGWSDAVRAADQLVDVLQASGRGDLVRSAVTVVTAPRTASGRDLAQRVHRHFTGVVRAVVTVPADPALAAGGEVAVSRLRRATWDAWLHAAAAVVDGL